MSRRGLTQHELLRAAPTRVVDAIAAALPRPFEFLVASFLGATTVRAKGLHGWSWWAVVALVIGLAIAAVLLSNWQLRFAIDAPELYDELYEAARDFASPTPLG